MISAWWSWIAGVSLQAMALLAVVFVLDAVLLRRGWPAVRVALWCAVLARLLLPPDLAAPWSLASTLAANAPVEWTPTIVRDAGRAKGWIFGLWLAGVVGFAMRAFLARHALERLVARAHDAPRHAERELARLGERLGLARVPMLRVSDELGGPAVVVLGSRTVVMLPTELLGPGTAFEREHALLHEIAHLVRRDPLAARVVAFVRALFWFHPAAWIASRKLAELRELGADARVAAELRERTPEYRAVLLAAAARQHGLAAPSGASGFVSGPSLLLLRLSRLERPLWRTSRLERAAGAAAFLAFALFVLPMACELPRRIGLDSTVSAALARWERAVASDERQNCLEVQAAARILQAHAQLTGEDLTRTNP